MQISKAGFNPSRKYNNKISGNKFNSSTLNVNQNIAFTSKNVKLLNGYYVKNNLVKKVMSSIMKLRSAKTESGCDLDKIMAVLNLENACKNPKFKFTNEDQINALVNEKLLKRYQNGEIFIPAHVKKIFLAGGQGTGICRVYCNPVTGEKL